MSSEGTYDDDISEQELQSDTYDAMVRDEDSQHGGPASTTLTIDRKRKSESRPAPRKRKKSKAQQILDHYYSESYREFFNSELAKFKDGTGFSERGYKLQGLFDEQIGIVKWTSEEKELFFNALARFGRGNVRAIAAHIGTKSPLEVNEYIRILEDALLQSHNDCGSQDRKFGLAIVADFPAAYEISHECEKALVRAAHVLSLHQEEYELSTERQLHGDYAVIDSSVAELIEGHLAGGEDPDGIVSASLPAAILLDPREWINLSTNVFMNPSGSDKLSSNWQTLSQSNSDDIDNDIEEKIQTPSLTYTAFSDFYTLAVSITRRIIQTLLFVSESRIRATSVKHHTRQRLVRTRDVHATLDILNMKHSKFDFWVSAARRNHLSVIETPRTSSKTGRMMSCDEVETYMRNPQSRRPPKKQKENDDGISEIHEEGDDLDDQEGKETDQTLSMTGSSSRRPSLSPAPSRTPLSLSTTPHSPPPPPPPPPPSSSPPPSPITARASLLDHEAAKSHESYIWTEVLETTPPPPPISLHASHPNPRPQTLDQDQNQHQHQHQHQHQKTRLKRKPRDEIQDIKWRQAVKYVGSDWETMGTVVAEKEFQDMERLRRANKRRRLAREEEEAMEESGSEGSAESEESEESGSGNENGIEIESDGSEDESEVEVEDKDKDKDRGTDRVTDRDRNRNSSRVGSSDEEDSDSDSDSESESESESVSEADEDEMDVDTDVDSDVDVDTDVDVDVDVDHETSIDNGA